MASEGKGFNAVYCGMCDGYPMLFDSDAPFLFRVVDEGQSGVWGQRAVGKTYWVDGGYAEFKAIEDVNIMFAL